MDGLTADPSERTDPRMPWRYAMRLSLLDMARVRQDGDTAILVPGILDHHNPIPPITSLKEAVI